MSRDRRVRPDQSTRDSVLAVLDEITITDASVGGRQERVLLADGSVVVRDTVTVEITGFQDRSA